MYWQIYTRRKKLQNANCCKFVVENQIKLFLKKIDPSWLFRRKGIKGEWALHQFYSWRSLVEGDEGLFVSNCQTNLVIAHYELSQLFWYFLNTKTQHLDQFEPSYSSTMGLQCFGCIGSLQLKILHSQVPEEREGCRGRRISGIWRHRKRPRHVPHIS